MQNELYHFGVKGMKWGVRRRNIQLAKHELKNAKKDYRDAAKEGGRIAWGTKEYRNMSQKSYEKLAINATKKMNAAEERVKKERLNLQLAKNVNKKRLSTKTKKALYDVEYDSAYDKLIREKNYSNVDRYHYNADKQARKIVQEYSKLPVSELLKRYGK